MNRFAYLALVVCAAGCGDDPVSVSAPVGINLKAESGDVNGTAISDEKGITTESGNPYGAFVGNAMAQLGADPARIDVDSLTLTLGAQSTGVTGLDQVYAGDVDVLFLMNDTNNTYPVASVVDPAGTGPVAIDAGFSSDDLSDEDYAKLLTGSFKVVIRGTAAAEFATKGAKADLQLVFTFAAFE